MFIIKLNTYVGYTGLYIFSILVKIEYFVCFGKTGNAGQTVSCFLEV